MSVFRVHKTENYTVMSNTHFKEKDMSLKAKGLLSLMLSLPDSWSYSVSGLVKLSKDGKDSVMSALGELEKFGYLTRTRVTNDKGQFAGVQYNIYEQPQPKKPIAEMPISEEQKQVNPISEEPPQLSTNEIKDESIKDLKELSIKEKEKEIKDVLSLSVHNQELQELYEEYAEVREGLNAPLTERTLKMLIARNERLSQGNIKIQKLLLENAIINNWKNIFLPSESEISTVSKELKGDLQRLFGL